MSSESTGNLSQNQSQNQMAHSSQAGHVGFNSLAAAAAAVSKHSDTMSCKSAMNDKPTDMSSSSMQAALNRTGYSGVDKLLLAAMVEESSSASKKNNNLFPPASEPSNTSTSQISSSSTMVIPMSHMFVPPPPPQQSHQMFLAPPPQTSPYIPVGRGIGNPFYTSSLMTHRDHMLNTPTPRNKSELELYRLLEKANLLNYFSTFISCGGDDVQQLCDADEEEFLEIMTLIGMTQKPLHVRRLQKALFEWRECRGEIFDSPYKRPNPVPQTNHHYISRHHLFQQPTHHMSPSQHQYSTNLDHNCNTHNHDNERNQSRSSTTIMVESPAPTLNSIASSQAHTVSDLNSTMQPQYISPHEVLKGAPKRPRLMDSIKPRDLTKMINVDDLDDEKLDVETTGTQ